MYWADELAERVQGPQVVNDSKTPSGTVHVGSLRGPVVHDVIARALRARGVPVEFRYGVEDMDAMDAQAIWVAAQQPHIKPVPVKSERQQTCLGLHAMRRQLMKIRVEFFRTATRPRLRASNWRWACAATASQRKANTGHRSPKLSANAPTIAR